MGVTRSFGSGNKTTRHQVAVWKTLHFEIQLTQIIPDVTKVAKCPYTQMSRMLQKLKK